MASRTRWQISYYLHSTWSGLVTNCLGWVGNSYIVSYDNNSNTDDHNQSKEFYVYDPVWPPVFLWNRHCNLLLHIGGNWDEKSNNFMWSQLSLCVIRNLFPLCLKVKQKIVEVCKNPRKAKMNLNVWGELFRGDMKAPNPPLRHQDKLHSCHSQLNWTNSSGNGLGWKKVLGLGRMGSGWTWKPVCASHSWPGKKEQGTPAFSEQR